MTIQDWGAVGEMIGAVAIMVSLVYVGLQIRQSTQASRAATNQAFSAQYGALIETMTRADFRDIFWRGIKGLGNLKEGELVAFMGYVGSLLRMWEAFYYQMQDGTFDDKIFKSWLVLFVDTFGNAGVREFWAIRKHQFSDDFVNFVEQHLEGKTPRTMYPEKVQQ
jgi:hypothetical protein